MDQELKNYLDEKFKAQETRFTKVIEERFTKALEEQEKRFTDTMTRFATEIIDQ
ncbi:hypothetical protein [Alicyclobacillus suci]|uniref:hypothetical protein n=1 Tax=Alicyclobacillus suci TaxID=2816080 RepID=UPI0016627FC5|nr:hypothetical protein [Alicyclobacillus suci]